jgi:hypothetical protein
VVAPHHHHRSLGEARRLEPGPQVGKRTIEETHGVEVVAERAALELAELELLEPIREALEGVVE